MPASHPSTAACPGGSPQPLPRDHVGATFPRLVDPSSPPVPAACYGCNMSREPSPEVVPAGGRLLLGLAVSAGALALVATLLDLDRVVASFLAARPVMLLAALPLVVTSLLTRARAWQLLLSAPVPLATAFAAVNQGYLVNTLLPLRLGDPARALILARDASLPVLRVLPTVVVERALDVAFALTLLLAGAGALGAQVSGRLSTSAVALALVPFQLAAVALAVALASRHRAGLVARLSSPRGPLRALRLQLAEALAGLAVLEHPGRFARAAVWLGCTWLQAVAIYWLCLAAFVPGPDPLHVAFGLGVAAFGVALPSSPAGIGVVEAAWTGALGLVGVDQEAAFAFAVTSHLLVAAVPVALGGWALARRGVSLGDLYRRLRRAAPTSGGANA